MPTLVIVPSIGSRTIAGQILAVNPLREKNPGGMIRSVRMIHQSRETEMSKISSRFMAALLAQAAVMGSAPGGVIENIVNIGRRSLARKRRAPRKRLQIATGPGSISAKAEFDQLRWAGRDWEASNLAARHRAACGEVLLP